jgi:hypothetical protein
VLNLPRANLLVVEREDGHAYYAKWRHDGRQVKRRIGPAWIVRGDAAKAGRRRTRHDGWIKRRGNVGESYLCEDEAVALIPGLIAEHEAEQKRASDKWAKEAEREIMFDEIAEAWLAHRIAVVGIKRTTRNDYETMLLRPGDRPKKRGRAPRARGIPPSPRTPTCRACASTPCATPSARSPRRASISSTCRR